MLRRALEGFRDETAVPGSMFKGSSGLGIWVMNEYNLIKTQASIGEAFQVSDFGSSFSSNRGILWERSLVLVVVTGRELQDR
jgi:hypothetical protein